MIHTLRSNSRFFDCIKNLSQRYNFGTSFKIYEGLVLSERLKYSRESNLEYEKMYKK